MTECLIDDTCAYIIANEGCCVGFGKNMCRFSSSL